MAAPLTQFQKKMAARRSTSSIDRLSRQYQDQINSITGEYETSFADYTKKRAEAMAPFESATEQYKKEYSVYETNVSGYKEKLAKHQAVLDEIKKNPSTQVAYTWEHQRADYYAPKLVRIPGVGDYSPLDLPSGYSMKDGILKKNRPIPSFSEKAPVAPSQPTPPEIPEFDTKPFEEKRALNEETYKREVGERKAARLGAVSRKGTRPLLSGTNT